MPLSDALLRSAAGVSASIREGGVSPRAFREALLAVPRPERDAWLDAVLGLDELPEDSAELPRGCVPYMPCAADAIVELVDHTALGPDDVFVDVGSGVGRAAVTAHLLSGADTIGVEIQSHLAASARALTARLDLPRCATVHGDAACLTAELAIGTVFFLYCPFGGARVAKVLDEIAPLARVRRVRVSTLDLPLAPRAWLERVGHTESGVILYDAGPRV